MDGVAKVLSVNHILNQISKDTMRGSIVFAPQSKRKNNMFRKILLIIGIIFSLGDHASSIAEEHNSCTCFIDVIGGSNCDSFLGEVNKDQFLNFLQTRVVKASAKTCFTVSITGT